LLAKHGVDTVDNLQHANLERFTGAELDAVHKVKVGKAAKGNVAAKRAAVATLHPLPLRTATTKTRR
jgi:hypothetical protein